jgi:hypothetical protein
MPLRALSSLAMMLGQEGYCLTVIVGVPDG